MDLKTEITNNFDILGTSFFINLHLCSEYYAHSLILPYDVPLNKSHKLECPQSV